MSTTAGTDEGTTASPRDHVAKYLLAGSGILLVLAILGAIIVVKGLEPAVAKEEYKYYFSTMLPMIGTWVGTILAYYFSKDNFDAATQAQRLMVRDITQERLRTIAVEATMIRKDEIDAITLASGQAIGSVLVRNVIALIRDKKRSRVPVLDSEGAVQLVLHQSIVYRFIAENGQVPGQAEAVTLDQLLGYADSKVLANAFAFVPRSATLADAKVAMEQKAHAQDVFVTAGGQPGEPIVGWLTNVDIARHSRA